MEDNILKSYKLTGLFRKTTDIGEMQKFKVDSIGSTPKIAMENIRLEMYTDGYQYILFQHVFLDGVEIPMMQALELE